MDNSEHQKGCICAWCEVERQNASTGDNGKQNARRSAAACSGSSVRDLKRHHGAWVKHFVKPVAHFMRERGISELRIKIGKNGKASYLLEPDDKWLGDKEAYDHEAACKNPYFAQITELVTALRYLSGLCERAWDGMIVGSHIRNHAKRVLSKYPENDQVELPPNGGSESKKGVVGG